MGNEPSRAARTNELLGEAGSPGTLASGPKVPATLCACPLACCRTEADRMCAK